MWKQLVQPDTSVVGTIGMCLKYMDDVYRTPHGIPTATAAWNKAQFKHTDRSFPSVAVPIWFSYVIGGQNLGHVANMMPNGQIYSSPYKAGQGHAVLSSIEELIRIYSNNGKNPMSYLGWSEDISGVRVAINEGGDMDTPLTPQEASDFYANYLGLTVPVSDPATQNRKRNEFIFGLLGQCAGMLRDKSRQYNALYDEVQAERKGYDAQVQAGQAIADVVGVKHGADDVDMAKVLQAVKDLKASPSGDFVQITEPVFRKK